MDRPSFDAYSPPLVSSWRAPLTGVEFARNRGAEYHNRRIDHSDGARDIFGKPLASAADNAELGA